MRAVFFFLLLVALSIENGLTTTTKIQDFIQGTRIRMSLAPGETKPQRRPSSVHEKGACEVRELCSVGDQLQIQVKGGSCVGCLKGQSEMETRDDLKFAYYSHNHVNYCSGNGWVLSADFSGCQMASWRDGGERRVGHVDTGDNARGRCKVLMRSESGTFFKPFNPADGTKINKWTKKIVSKSPASDKTSGNYKVYIFSVVSDTNDFYTMYAQLVEKSDTAWIFEVLEKPSKRSPLSLADI